MKDVFRISRLIIKRKFKVLTDAEESELEAFGRKYSMLKEFKIKDLAKDIDTTSGLDKEKAWAELLEKYAQINQEDSKEQESVPLHVKRRWYSYAAAAAVVGLVATTFYWTYQSGEATAIKSAPAVVHNNFENIKTGTDKATLTLGNGERLALEKGSSIQTQNAKSNGEEIVYAKANQTGSKLVYNYLTIPRGGQFVLQLSDGTKVWLNSESQLKFPVSFLEGSPRTVELVYGEAYFEVSPSEKHKGAHFQVLNKGQKVEVVGTQFNIKAYRDESNIYTTLVEGKVDVEIDHKIQKLVPKEQLNFNLKSHTTSIKTVEVYYEISWKDGLFNFRSNSLKEIMKVISRWYDVDVVFENKKLETVQFKGSLEKKQSLEDILFIMKSKTIDGYELKGKTLIIK